MSTPRNLRRQSGHIRPEKTTVFPQFFHIFSQLEPIKKYEPLIRVQYTKLKPMKKTYQLKKKSISCYEYVYLGKPLNLDTFLKFWGHFEDIFEKIRGKDRILNENLWGLKNFLRSQFHSLDLHDGDNPYNIGCITSHCYPCVGHLMGGGEGPQCRLSILRNGNVPCRYLKKNPVDPKIPQCHLSILRSGNVPCRYFYTVAVDF